MQPLTRVARLALLLLPALAFGATGRAADPPGSPTPASVTVSNLVIASTNGGYFSAATAVFRGAVQVLEAQMYLECELLTIYFETNRADRPGRPGATATPTPAPAPASANPAAEAGALTDVNARVDTIVAETNLLMMFRDITILGDRAVYTQSNEVVVVTGPLVVIERSESMMYGTNFVFNLRTGEGYPVGPNVMELKLGPPAGGGGTNAGPGLRLDGRKTAVPRPRQRAEPGPGTKSP